MASSSNGGGFSWAAPTTHIISDASGADYDLSSLQNADGMAECTVDPNVLEGPRSTVAVRTAS